MQQPDQTSRPWTRAEIITGMLLLVPVLIALALCADGEPWAFMPLR